MHEYYDESNETFYYTFRVKARPDIYEGKFICTRVHVDEETINVTIALVGMGYSFSTTLLQELTDETTLIKYLTFGQKRLKIAIASSQ